MKINDEIKHLYPWRPSTFWKARTEAVAGMIPRGYSVIDIGGGMGNLYQYLEKKDDYISIDYQLWTDRTIVADLNAGQYPDILHPHKFTAIVCQGILEYINDVDLFLKSIRKYGDKLIISYRTCINTPMPRNELSFASLTSSLAAAGWRVAFSKDLLKWRHVEEKVFYCIKDDDQNGKSKN